MKTIRIIIFGGLILLTSIVVFKVFGHATTQKRFACAPSIMFRYVAKTGIYYGGGFEAPGAQKDRGCSYASAYSSALGCTAKAYRSQHVKVETSTHTTYARGGMGYSGSTDTILGFSKVLMECDSLNIFYDSSDNGIIQLENVHEFELAVQNNTDFSAIFRMVIWKPHDILDSGGEILVEDSIPSQSKILWDSHVRIENGHVFYTGIFDSTMFDITFDSISFRPYNQDHDTSLYCLKVNMKEGFMDDGILLNFYEDIIEPLRLNNPNGVSGEDIDSATIENVAVLLFVSEGLGEFEDPYSEGGESRIGQFNEAGLKTKERNQIKLVGSCVYDSFGKAIVYESKGKANSNFSFEIYDLFGRRVENSQHNFSENGICEIDLQKHRLPAGVYIIKMMQGINTFSERILIK